MKIRYIVPIILTIIIFTACTKQSVDSNNGSTVHLVILYTNDEHGWMEATETSGGAAGLMHLWKRNEGYSDNGSFLVLSGGDMWTGPAVSTLFEGESMAQVMNAMGYQAAAIGNHEFDFKIEGLLTRREQSEFPFLSANIRMRNTMDYSDIADPYTIVQVSGISVGIIGLTTVSTPGITFPTYVEDYDFIPYEQALADVVPHVKAAGAELLIVIACWPAMRSEHWVRLLQARAIENQAYVLGVNRCGREPNLQFDGRSTAFDPHGKQIFEADAKEQIVPLNLDLETVRQWRAQFPALRDIRH